MRLEQTFVCCVLSAGLVLLHTRHADRVHFGHADLAAHSGIKNTLFTDLITHSDV
jgi:hypothetical protein